MYLTNVRRETRLSAEFARASRPTRSHRPLVSAIAAAAIAASWLLAAIPARAQSPDAVELVVQEGQAVYGYDISSDGEVAIALSSTGMVKLWSLRTGKELRTYIERSDEGEVEKIGHVAISGDGRLAATVNFNECTVWDAATWTKKGTYKASWTIGAVSMNSDGSRLALLEDKRPREFYIVDVASMKAVVKTATMGQDEAEYSFYFTYSARLSPDGRTVAINSPTGKVQTRDAATGALVRVFTVPGRAASTALSPDGRSLACGSDKGKVWIFDLGTGSVASVLNPPGSIERTDLHVAYSKDGSVLYCHSENGQTIWRYKTSDWSLAGSTGLGFRVSGPIQALEGGTKVFLVGSKDHGFKIVDAPSGRVESEMSESRGYSTRPLVAAFSPDSKTFAVGGQDGSVKIWDATTGKCLRGAQAHKEFLWDLAYVGKGESIVSSDGKSVSFWDARTLDRVAELPNPLPDEKDRYPALYTSLAVSPDGKTLAAGAQCMKLEGGKSFYEIQIWNVAERRKVRTIKEPHADSVESLAFSADGKRLASGSDDGTVKIWKTGTWKLEKTIDSSVRNGVGDISTDCKKVAISPDGAYVLSVGLMAAQAFSVGTGSKLGFPIYDYHALPVEDATISKDGVSVIYGGQFCQITKKPLWAEAPKTTFIGHARKIVALVESPDGRHILSVSDDTTCKLWDSSSGQCLYTAVSDSSGATWLSFTPDGYWDGSPNCGGLVAVVRGLESWNIDQFAVHGNRPDIIAKRAGGAPETVAELKAAWLRRLRKLGMSEDGVSTSYKTPRATIESVSRDGRFADLALRLEPDGLPLQAYQVYSNGVPILAEGGKPAPEKGATVVERVELAPGTNRIEVACVDAGGTESLRANELLVWDGKTTPNLYFIGFGVSVYADPGIRDLSYAAKDATSLAAAFSRMEGKAFGKVYSTVFTDAQVTASAIGTARERLKGARPEDTVVLFISGHGIQLEGTSEPPNSVSSAASGGKGLAVKGSAPAAPAERTYYYVTADARLADLPGTAVPFERIEGILQAVAARNKLFLMDTCESGEADESSPRIAASGSKAVTARTLAPESRKGLSVVPSAAAKVGAARDRFIYSDLLRRSGTVVFSSCLGDEASLESDAWKQGAFTLAILKALGDPRADRDGNKAIDIAELRGYVSALVPNLVAQLDPKASQHPTVDRDNIYARFSFPLTP